MKTVTTREVQHHFSKVLEVVESGEEVSVTRRGQEVALIYPPSKENPMDREVDWAAALQELGRDLGHLPTFDRGIVEEMRKDERY